MIGRASSMLIELKTPAPIGTPVEIKLFGVQGSIDAPDAVVMHAEVPRATRPMRALAQLRTGSHWGAEETGRWARVPREQRCCPHCSGGRWRTPLTCCWSAHCMILFGPPTLTCSPTPVGLPACPAS
jgi:hypothetical protein